MTKLSPGAHVPWAQIDNYLSTILALGLAPEVAIKGPELDNIDQKLLDKVADLLCSANIRPTVHAPFFDLNPGALDPLIREATRTRLCQSIDIAARINARLMVIHPGVDKWRYPNLDQTWLGHAKDFFPLLIEQAAESDCKLAMENIYEETPDTLIQLVDSLDSEWFGHCFDVGHWHLFGKCPMAEWLEAIDQKLMHLHLHDNHGRADEHLPVGDGTIDFQPMQQHLQKKLEIPSFTLEAHTPEHLKRSLQQTSRLFT
jgi:sugar phosphate isomerase/epimerase